MQGFGEGPTTCCKNWVFRVFNKITLWEEVYLATVSKEAIIEADLNHLWHPFTQMKEWFEWGPLIIERGEGNYLIDIDGNRYIDGVSSLWANIHGHNREEINSAILEQVKRISHSTLLGLTHPNASLLAKRLAEIAPGHLNWVFYSEAGATAVEIAIKMAFQYWQNKGLKEKTKFVCLKEGYHGDTIGAVSVGGIQLFHEIYGPLLFQTIKLPCPYLEQKRLGLSPEEATRVLAEEYEQVIKPKAHEIAAFILEPLVQGAGGILPFPPGLLKEIENISKRHHILLIADEVAVGFGRTGSMFACEQEDVMPDLMVLGKAITGGYLPLAATLATDKVFEAFWGDYEELRTFYHGHTYTGNPVCCAAALASLDLFEKDKVLENLPQKIDLLRQGLEELRGLAHVADIRQVGLMAGIEIMMDPLKAVPYDLGERMGHKVCMGIRKHGVILRNLGDVIVIMPPLSISGEEIEKIVSGVKKAILEVCG